MRPGNQLASLLAITEREHQAGFESHLHFVRTELTYKLDESNYHAGLDIVGLVDRTQHPELHVIAWFEQIGVLVRTRYLEEAVYLDVAPGRVAFFGTCSRRPSRSVAGVRWQRRSASRCDLNVCRSTTRGAPMNGRKRSHGHIGFVSANVPSMMNTRIRNWALAVLSALVLTTSLPAAAATAKPQATIVLAGGCFWGMEEVFESLKGVSSATAGYSGGSKMTAHYEIVSMGTTGHAESVRVTYDPAVVSLETILRVYFLAAHNPTELDRQGPDSGTQYRSAIFYANNEQRAAAQAMVKSLTDKHQFNEPIVTQIVALKAFYPAEAYHQRFAERNPNYPYIAYVDKPIIDGLYAKFPDLLKKRS